jgi:hypothetical protein
MGRIATFKWFTDTYTRGSWESGVSDNMFSTSRANVSATSNKAINYNDLLNPSSYGNTIGATANKCVEQTDITNLMRPTNFTVDITKNAKVNGTIDIYIICTDFDSTATSLGSGSEPIKLEVIISNGAVNTTYNVNVNYPGTNNNAATSYVINNAPSSSVRINRVSVFRGNTIAPYIVKPQITFNYGTGLSVSVSGQAANFATVGSEISNYVPGSGGGSGTTGRVLTINSSWKSTDEAEDNGLSFEMCWGYVASKEDSTVYLIENPESGTAIYVEDDNKEMGEYIGKYIVFYGETIDLSVPLFLSYEVRDWGDTYSLS